MTYKKHSFLLMLWLAAFSLKAHAVDFKKITFKGNDRTKEVTLLRELVLQPNVTYTATEFTRRANRSAERLMNLNLFNRAEVFLNPSDSSELVVELVEKWYFWPIPFVESSDRNLNVWSQLNFDPQRTNYGLYLFNYNLWGRNQTLKTSLVQGYNAVYALEYRMPFIDASTNWGMSADIRYKSQAELWLNTRNDELQFYRDSSNLDIPLIKQFATSLTAFNRMQPHLTAYGTVYHQSTRLDSSVQPLNPHYLLSADRNLNVLGVGGGVEWDKRNNIYFTTEGNFLGFLVDFQQFSSDKNTLNLYASAAAKHFKRLNKRWYSALSVYGDYNTLNALPYEYTRRLGYNYAIRGFEQRVIDGNSCVLTNSAIRYHLVEKPNLPTRFVPFKNYKFLPLNIYVEAFVDAGYVWNHDLRPTNDLPNQLLYSTGISLQTLFYNDRVLRLEYSLNSLKEGGFFVHLKKAI